VEPQSLQLSNPYQRAMNVIERWKEEVADNRFPRDVAATHLGYALMAELELAYDAGFQDALRAASSVLQAR
jgi:hypothetical protein